MKNKPQDGWASAELSNVDLGDKRLDMRLIKTAGQLSEQPLAFINQATGSWADTKAAYRLFDNARVSASRILRSHREQTRLRLSALPWMFAIQDTTYLNYSHHPHTCGLGSIGVVPQGKANQQGIVMHTTMGLSSQGLPLGLIDQKIMVRPVPDPSSQKSAKTNRACRTHKTLPIEEKESYRWIESLEHTVALLGRPHQIVTICDREADIYEFLCKSQELETHVLVRGAWDRRLAQESCEEDQTIWSFMQQQPCGGRLTVAVPERPREPARVAQVEVRWGQVNLRPPQRLPKAQSGALPCLPVFCVWVKEVNAPKGVKPLEWMLLTDLPVNQLEEAVEKITWYRLRWQIENYHKVLKSGCRVEACRLETADRLVRYLALMSVIAWRLHWLTHVNRQAPQESCCTILAEEEWKALYCRIHRSQAVPDIPPTVRQAVRWIAQLGGFLGRKGDGEPGVTTIWRGWQRLTDLAEAYRLFSRTKQCG